MIILIFLCVFYNFLVLVVIIIGMVRKKLYFVVVLWLIFSDSVFMIVVFDWLMFGIIDRYWIKLMLSVVCYDMFLIVFFGVGFISCLIIRIVMLLMIRVIVMMIGDLSIVLIVLYVNVLMMSVGRNFSMILWVKVMVCGFFFNRLKLMFVNCC